MKPKRGDLIDLDRLATPRIIKQHDVNEMPLQMRDEERGPATTKASKSPTLNHERYSRVDGSKHTLEHVSTVQGLKTARARKDPDQNL